MTDRRAFFPNAHSAGTQARVTAFWDLDHPLPMPRRRIDCGQCGGFMIVKQWWFHDRTKTGTNSPYRCDVQTKCIDCSFVAVYGIAVPKTMWIKRPTPLTKDKRIYWRQGVQVLEQAGYFD